VANGKFNLNGDAERLVRVSDERPASRVGAAAGGWYRVYHAVG
jgi:hypothetical protein